MSEEGKGRGVTGDQQNRVHYGTFQGVANYYPPAPQPQPQPQPVVGFPQPVPPPGYHHHHPYGYQTVHGINSNFWFILICVKYNGFVWIVNRDWL